MSHRPNMVTEEDDMQVSSETTKESRKGIRNSNKYPTSGDDPKCNAIKIGMKKKTYGNSTDG